MVEAETFWDRTAEKYAASPIKDEAAYEATLARVRAHLRPDMDVLEIGCGTGTTALKLADAARSITATDIAGRMLAIAEEKRVRAGVETVRFTQATLDDHAFEPESFDAVVAFNLLHLLEDLPAALREIWRLTAPGGLFLSKTVCLAERGPWLPLLVGAMRLAGRAPHVAFLKSGELDAMIEAAGFTIVETGNYPEKAKSHFVAARKT